MHARATAGRWIQRGPSATRYGLHQHSVWVSDSPFETPWNWRCWGDVNANLYNIYIYYIYLLIYIHCIFIYYVNIGSCVSLTNAMFWPDWYCQFWFGMRIYQLLGAASPKAGIGGFASEAGYGLAKSYGQEIWIGTLLHVTTHFTTMNWFPNWLPHGTTPKKSTCSSPTAPTAGAKWLWLKTVDNIWQPKIGLYYTIQYNVI